MSKLDPYACGASCGCDKCDPCDKPRPLEVLITNGMPQAEPDPCINLPLAFDAATGCFYMWTKTSGWFQADSVELTFSNTDTAGNGDLWVIKACDQQITIVNSRNVGMELEHRGGGDNDGAEWLILTQTYGPPVEVNLSDLDSYVSSAIWPSPTILRLVQTQGKPPVDIDLSGFASEETEIRRGTGSREAIQTLTANPNGGLAPVTWRETWMQRTGSIVTINSWNPITNEWDSVAIEAPEDIVILNNPVIYLNSATGTATPPIDVQADLATNPFNSFNAVRAFMARALVVGVVTLDCSGTFTDAGAIGPAQFKNAQNIVVRGNGGNAAAASIMWGAPSNIGAIITGGSVRFENITMQAAEGAVTDFTTAFNVNYGAELLLGGTIRFTGKLDQGVSGRPSYILRNVNGGRVTINSDATIAFSMGAGTELSNFVAVGDGSALRIGGDVTFAYSGSRIVFTESFITQSAGATVGLVTNSASPGPITFTGAARPISPYSFYIGPLCSMTTSGVYGSRPAIIDYDFGPQVTAGGAGSNMYVDAIAAINNIAGP